MNHHLRTTAIYLGVLLSVVPSLQAKSEAQPKLIVQITVDQFRSDYLTRFSPALNRGVARILKNGMVDIEGEVDHAITNSAPGHTTLSTGSYPSTHGYSANEWWDFRDGKWTWVDGATDPKAIVLGSADRIGHSAINMKVSTLGEWVTKADKQAKSILIGASEVTVLYAGKTSNHAYWYDREAGRYITSTYYTKQYPEWVRKFNSEKLPLYKQEIWELSVTDEYQSLADKDDQSFESFGEHYVFPHRFSDEYDPDHERSREKQLDYWFYETPMADISAFNLAKIAIHEEKLGQRGHTDYLSIALGATDNIGHIYGGYSLEILDTMVRIDSEIDSFITYLNSTVGADNYILAISGDHGAPEPIERTLENGGNAYRISTQEIDTLLDHIDEIGTAHIGSRQELIDKIEQRLEAASFIQDAITEDEVYGSKPSDNPFLHLYKKSWVKGRVPDFPLWTSTPNRPHHPARYGIFVQFRENTYFSFGMVVHGSPYQYDRSVPILFYGHNIPARSLTNARTIDIAPTLAKFAGIEAPGFVDGVVLK
ncbi:MAG: alkaline phosphatase family protein [Kordiimonas sp.]